LSGVCAAIPAPASAPTTVWVVETGMPYIVAIVRNVALPTSAQPMTSMKVGGAGTNLSKPNTPDLIVEVTLEPSATAPRNSVKHARIPACHIFRVRAATDVAYELATSLAPLEADEKTKAIVVKARIQLYFWRAGAMVGECSGSAG
jgi:hypothetical protein